MLLAAAPPVATYQQATTAFQSGQWQTAAEDYAALAAALPLNGPDRAVIDARRGYALYRLSKTTEARDLLESALSRVPPGPNYRIDRALEHGALAAIYEGELWPSRALAARHYRLASNDAESAIDRVTLLTGIVRNAMFDADFDPVATSRQAVTLAETSKLPRETVAYTRALLGRALLNRGQPKEALEMLQTVITDLGGLDRRIDALQFTARADAALAALALGKNRIAQEYLAYSGSGIGAAGRLVWPNVNFGSIGCAEDIKPEDYAVVELTIDDTGAPQKVHTIYANRPGQPGHWFEDAVVSWRWSPDAVASIGSVRRQHMRFELRCSVNWIKDHIAIEPREPFWAARGLPPFVQSKGAGAEARLTAARVELAARERQSGINDPALLPVLDAIYRSELVNTRESGVIADRALAIVQQMAPPPLVLIGYREDADSLRVGSGFLYDPKP